MYYYVCMKNALIAIFVIAAVVLAWYFYDGSESVTVSSFEECAAVYPVMESYPRQCRDNKGNHFVETVAFEGEPTYTNADESIIVIDDPAPGSIVSSRINTHGMARGYWFFEASFPIVVEDENGNVIGQHFAGAQDDWMTEDMVLFESAIELDVKPKSGTRGVIRYIRDNPSDLPENSGSVEIPVVFE